MWWLIVVGFVCVSAAVWMLLRQQFGSPRVYTPPATNPANSSGAMAPVRWDEQLIAQQLHNLSNRPAIVAHYIDSLKDRFIVRQDYRTAQTRIEFLRTTLSQLKTAKELQLSLDDLQFHEMEREIRRRELELKQENLNHQHKKQRELDELEREKDTLALKLEIARLQRQIEEEKKPPSPPPKLSPEEERAKQRTRLEAELARLRQDKATAESNATSDEEKVRMSNMYDDKIDRILQDLSKYL